MTTLEVEKLNGLSLEIQLLMFDGDIKPIHQLKIGDVLMGDDSTPRHVVSIKTIDSSKTKLFEIEQKKGIKYKVNRDNYISLKLSRLRTKKNFKIYDREYVKNSIVDIRLQDYMNLSKTVQLDFKGFKTSINFASQPILIPPYLLGLWIMDTSILTTEITISDSLILEHCYNISQHYKMTMEFSKGNRYTIDFNDKTKKNFHECLTEMKLLESKYIPQNYKINSREIRMNLLAGIIDCEGYVNNNCYELTTKNEKLVDDICFLCNSLGFYASKSSQPKTFYFRIIISGDLSSIPVHNPRKKMSERKQIKNILHTGVAVKPLDDTNSCIELSIDGNGRFVTSDFTVLHT